MSTRTDQLKKQIDDLQAEQTRLSAVGNARMNEAATKNDTKLVDQAVEAFTKVEELQAKVNVLNKTLATAVEIEKAARAVDWQREHRERIATVHTLAEQRIKQAKAVDAAFVALQKAIAECQSTSNEITALVRDFSPARHLSESARSDRMRGLIENAKGDSPAFSFALSRMFQRMLIDTGLIHAVDPYLSFTHVYVDIRRKSNTVADAANTTATQLKIRLSEKELASV